MSHSHEYRHCISWFERIVLVYLFAMVALTANSVHEGLKAEEVCIAHDERFVEVDSGLALCEHDDGSIAHRQLNSP